MSAEVQYLENFGRDGLEKPADLQWLVKESTEPLDVTLLVHCKTFHWLIYWKAPLANDDPNNPALRVIHLIQEINRDHLTNWGPLTKSVGRSTISGGYKFPLGKLTLQQRKALEAIAEEHPVQAPDGKYDCKTWIEQVVKKAIDAGIFEEDVVNKALADAYSISNPE